jgi:hypothetical protein
VDAATLQAILHQARRPWDTPAQNRGDAEARKRLGEQEAVQPGELAQEPAGQEGAGALSAPAGTDGFWESLRRALRPDNPTARASGGARELVEEAVGRGVSLSRPAGQVSLDRRRQLSALVEATTAALDVAEARAAHLEPRFREFKHDMHWRQSRQHAAALQISRAEEALFELEEAVLALGALARQLQHDVDRAAAVIGPEAIARGRERRLIGSRPPPPKPSADRADLADWLLSRLPL